MAYYQNRYEAEREKAESLEKEMAKLESENKRLADELKSKENLYYDLWQENNTLKAKVKRFEFAQKEAAAAADGEILLNGNVDSVINELSEYEVSIDWSKTERYRTDEPLVLKRKYDLTPRAIIGNFVAFDLETTGLSPYEDEIIEISAVRFRLYKAVKSFSITINPGCEIPYEVTELCGIDDVTASCSPTIEQVLSSFAEFVGGDPMVGHNIKAFDLKFLHRCGFNTAEPERNYYDTLSMAKKLIPSGNVKNYKLRTLLDYFGIIRTEEHRGLTDSVSAGLLFAALVSIQTNR